MLWLLAAVSLLPVCMRLRMHAVGGRVTDCACGCSVWFLCSVALVAGLMMTAAVGDFAFIREYVSVTGCSCLSDHRVLMLLLESRFGQSACNAVAACGCVAVACVYETAYVRGGWACD